MHGDLDNCSCNHHHHRKIAEPNLLLQANLWGSTKPGFRGGIVTPGQTNTIALEAE